MSARAWLAIVLRLAGLVLLHVGQASAEPYLALRMGMKCVQCHVNPTGGGMRTNFGDIYSQTVLPARRVDTGGDLWTGDINRFLRIGANARFDATATQVPHSPTITRFDVGQVRAYAAAALIPDRLELYADELVAPGTALNREAWLLYWSAAHDWYAKAGQMYLPFGLRFQDQSAFILQSSGINMTTPDRGVELGWLGGHWDAQLAVSNGTAAGSVSDSRKQYGAQLAWVDPRWRIGAALNYNDKLAGSRQLHALFAGLRVGPVVLLAQAESATSRQPSGADVRQRATLLEADWLIARGHNLKLTQEFLDPQHAIRHNGAARWSLVYELTPVQFMQLRTGVRDATGIPQAPAQNTRLYFLELHGFF